MAPGDVTTNVVNVTGFNGNMFDGVDDYVEIPHNEAQLGKNLSNGFTISAWINPRSLGEASTGRIIDKSEGTTAQNGFKIQMVSGNKLRAQINTGSTRDSGVISLNIWTHILLTFESNANLTFYINGVSSGTAGTTNAISQIITTNAMRIGNISSGTTTTFDGSIRSVKMWNRVLSSTEIAQDYAGTTPQNGLIHNFKLGGDYTDYGSVGVTATNSGSVPVIVSSNVATAIKVLRTNAGISGAYMIANGGKRGQQLAIVGIQQT